MLEEAQHLLQAALLCTTLQLMHCSAHSLPDLGVLPCVRLHSSPKHYNQGQLVISSSDKAECHEASAFTDTHIGLQA